MKQVFKIKGFNVLIDIDERNPSLLVEANLTLKGSNITVVGTSDKGIIVDVDGYRIRIWIKDE